MRFDPASVRRFRFLGYGFDEDAATARFDYGFDGNRRFRETLVFRGAGRLRDPERRAAFDRCLRFLHLAAGISYYKAAAPPEISVETGALTTRTARFFDRLYVEGLGEFAWRNRLELEPRIRFPAGAASEPPPAAPSLPRRTAVPVGGGKDSAVTIEALKEAGEPIVLFSVGDFEPIRATAEVSGVDRIVVERRLAPELLELNRSGAYNGHVPVSAIIAFVLAAAAALYGFEAAALSNERSADVPDLVWRGRAVNHEYSKGLAFESDVDRLFRRSVLPGFRYFSLLRPFSELSIAGLFGRLPGYLPVFRSCNAAYRQRPEQRAADWCCECPKCRFVFLALAPFVERRKLVARFGRNLLAEEVQRRGYEELAGLTAHRPLECVGEADETLAALALVAAAPEWRRDAVVAALAERALARTSDRRGLVRRMLTPDDEHRVPARFASALARLRARALEDRDRLLARIGPGRPSQAVRGAG